MRKSRFAEELIAGILKQYGASAPTKSRGLPHCRSAVPAPPAATRPLATRPKWPDRARQDC